jgi:hypothetical protein
MTVEPSDFIAKLRQIEELASGVHAELPESQMMWRTRIQHIVVLAKTLRGRLEFGSIAVVAVAPPPVEPSVPPPVETKKPPD